MNEQAVNALRSAVQAAPDSVPLRQSLAELLSGLARYDEAEQEYRRALALAPDFDLGHAVLAQALLARDRPDEAEMAACRGAPAARARPSTKASSRPATKRIEQRIREVQGVLV